ncbi:MAG: transcription antitermination factor NusB [bacterium]|nr:transcription antitermination factor NusB [bacterium]
MGQLKRRDIRIKVMQVLYAHLISGEPVKKIINDLMPDMKGEDNIEFATSLINYVIDNEKILDEYILEKVVNWELERMAMIDRILLRMGVAELLYFPDIPPKVSINEAIDISKEFCTRSSGKFVNGILDAVLEKLKKEKTLNKTGRGLVNMKAGQTEKKTKKPEEVKENK